MRIARFASGDDQPRFGVIGERDGESVLAVLTGDPLYAGIELTGQSLPLDDVRLLAPLIPRSKVVGIGRNYADHAAELDHQLPTEPLMFLKPNTSVIGPGDPILHPNTTEDLQWEAELAVVIGRICRDLPVEQVADVVLGYTVANDVTARDLQHADDQWTRAKGYDTFCPLGPWIETDLDVSDLRVTTSVRTGGSPPGGELRQDGRTSQLIFDVPRLVSYVSSIMTLLPGDVILTGTPAGVGRMVPGDQVSVSVEGIGTLTNPVMAA
ncbi:MAG: fumarylacetoacetate hydrolase family protein [Actinomycetota bacterium]|nr:fumarylacetoacetate hydrolase family protein [Actinomycetota bacterium]